MKIKEKVKSFFKDKKYRDKRIVIALWVFVLTIFTIGYSYAAFFSVKTNKNNQTVKTGTLLVSYGSSSAAITSNNMIRYSDAEGLEQKEARIIYIQNEGTDGKKGTLDANYVLTVGYDMEKFLARSDYDANDVLTPLEYIKVAVYELNTSTNNFDLLTNPVTLADLPVFTNNDTSDVKDGRYNRYAVLFDTLGVTTNSTKTYQIKMWLSDQAIEAVSHNYFYVNAEIIAEPDNSRMEYTLTGNLSKTATSTDITSLSGAKINLYKGANGSKKGNFTTTTTGSKGNFSITGLTSGTYKLSVVLNNVVYTGNIILKEGTSKSIKPIVRRTDNTLPMSISPTSNMTLAQAAYTYGNTVNDILNKNGITLTSNAYTFQSGTSYLINPTYSITGDSNSNLGTLNIELDKKADATNVNLTLN